MIVGCPKEIKTLENRIGMVPAAAHQLIQNGHHVVIEKNAGVGSGLHDDIYTQLGCEIVDTAEEVWARSDMIVKVKEPLAPEYGLMRENQLLYTYLHLAAEPELTQALLDRNVSGVAYETIEVNGNKLQGYWGLEILGNTLQGQTPEGATTVPNPFWDSAPIPQGSCIVTGAFDKPLTFSEDMDDDVVLNVHITTNQSFEWIDVIPDGVWEPSADEDVVDMGTRGIRAEIEE